MDKAILEEKRTFVHPRQVMFFFIIYLLEQILGYKCIILLIAKISKF